MLNVSVYYKFKQKMKFSDFISNKKKNKFFKSNLDKVNLKNKFLINKLKK